MGQNEKNIAFYNTLMSIKKMGEDLGLDFSNVNFISLYTNYKKRELNQCEEKINLLINRLKEYKTILRGHQIYKEAQLLLYMCEHAKIN